MQKYKKSAEKFGKKEKVRIFAARFGRSGEFFDNIGKDNEVKKRSKRNNVCNFFLERGSFQIPKEKLGTAISR